MSGVYFKNGLLNDSVISAPNDKVIGGKRSWKEAVMAQLNILICLDGHKNTKNFRITGLWTELWNQDLPNQGTYTGPRHSVVRQTIDKNGIFDSVIHFSWLNFLQWATIVIMLVLKYDSYSRLQEKIFARRVGCYGISRADHEAFELY